MENFFINRFRKGKWISRSNSILGDKAKVTLLLSRLPRYLQRHGLRRCKEDLMLVADYIRDVLAGRYKEFSRSALTLALAALLYVASPLDIVPDFIPTGLLDDATIVAWAIAQLTEELEKYAKSKSNPQDDEQRDTP